MRCLVHSTTPVRLIEVIGPLRNDTTAWLHLAVQKVPAEWPEAALRAAERGRMGRRVVRTGCPIGQRMLRQ